MATIVFIILPEKGHMNSTYKIARSLSAAGHHIYYAQIPDMEDSIRAQGFDFLPFLENVFPVGFVNQGFQTDLEAILLERAAAANLDSSIFGTAVSSIIDKIHPDLLILDFYLPNIGLIVEIVKKMGGPFTLFRTVLSVTPEFAAFEAPHHVIVPCPEEFDFPRAEQERIARHYYVEASIDLDRKEPALAWDRFDEKKTTIYCSLGTQSHLFEGSKQFRETVIEALAAKPDWQLIMSIGSDLTANDFHYAPQNALLVNHAPQLEILKKAALMITHGGVNTIKECILFGVPMIVCPLGRDQFLNAARVEYHHLGLRGPFPHASAGRLRALMEKVITDPLIKKSMMAMNKVFREKENSGQAVKVIESLLAK